MTEFFVIGINGAHGLDAGVLGRREIFAGALLIPVQNPAHEGRDQFGFGLGAGDGLRQGEEQRHIAIDSFALKDFGGANAFPRGSDFNQDPLARNAVLRVERDKPARLFDQTGCIKGQPGVGLSGDTARNQLENLHAEEDQEQIHDIFRHGLFVEIGFSGLSERVVHDIFIFRHLGSLENEAWVRGGIRGRVGFERGKIAGIGHDFGEALELLKLVECTPRSFFFDFCSLCHKTSAVQFFTVSSIQYTPNRLGIQRDFSA